MHKTVYKKLYLLTLFLAVVLCGFLSLGLRTESPVQAAAGINEQINYQGRLLTATGAVVPDGTYNMEFKIIQDGDGCNPTSGTPPCGGTVEWTETRTGSNKVTVKNGYFSVYLGSVTPFSSSVDWNQDTLWLSVNIGGTGTPSWDGEMEPFNRLSSSPYALNSKALGGLTASDFVKLAQGSQTDASLVSSIFINKTGASGNILELEKNGADVFLLNNTGAVTFQNSVDSTTGFQVLDADGGTPVFSVDTTNERVGIGDTTPDYKLDVEDTSTSTAAVGYSAANATLYVAPASASNTGFVAVSGTAVVTSGLDYIDNVVTGVSGSAQNQSATGTALILRGLAGQVVNDAAGTIGTSYAIQAHNAALNAGTITTNYGLYVSDQTSGTSDYGIAIAGADTQALWISSGANNTDAANGIGFGSSRDTNLYRSAVGTLKTDGDLVVGDITISNTYDRVYVGANTIVGDGTIYNQTYRAPGSTAAYFSLDPAAGIGVFNATNAAYTPLFIQGMAAQTGDLTRWKDSAGVILTAIDSAGKLVFGPSGSQDTNLYRSAANTLKTDDDFIVAGALSADGALTIGDAIGDAVTVNSGAWTFANDTTVALSGGVNGLNFDSNTLSIDATNNRVGIGTAAPVNSLSVNGTADIQGHASVGVGSTVNGLSLYIDAISGTTAHNTILTLTETLTSLSSATTAYEGLGSVLKLNPSGAPTYTNINGFNGGIEIASGNVENFSGGLIGATGVFFHNGTGTVSSSMGLQGVAGNLGGGTITDNVNLKAITLNLSGTITNNYGIDIATPINSGTVTNNYGIRIQDQSSVGSSLSYNIYSDGATAKNYFAGLVGIGDTTPDYLLDVAGTLGVDGNVTLGDATTDTVTVTGGLSLTNTSSTPLTIASSVGGVEIQGTSDNAFNIYSEGSQYFGIDSDNDTAETFGWINGTGGTIATLDETGNADFSGTLTAGSANTALTLSTGMIDADALTLVSAVDGRSGTSSASGLAVYSDGLSLLQGCSDGQVLAWVESTDTWNCTTAAGGGANTALSNLASVAINTSLLPATDDAIDLGDNTHRWRDLFLGPATLHIGTSTTDEYALTYDTTNNTLEVQAKVDSVEGFQVLDTDGGTPIFNVDTVNERVGIGTATPGQDLNLVTANAWGGIKIQGGTASSGIGMQFQNSTGYDWEFNVGGNTHSSIANKFSIYDADVGADRLTIDTNGNVGIGDTSPDARLDVEPTGAVTATSYAQQINNLQTNATTDAIDKYGLYVSSTGTFNGAGGTATNNYGLYVASPTGADNNYAGYFGGKVGIGTATPSNTLTVNDAGSTTDGGSIAKFGSGGSPTAGNLYGITIDKSGVQALMLGINKSSTTGSIPASGAYISTYTPTSTISFGRGNNAGLPDTADIFINSNGSIGIGTTSPATNSKLNVVAASAGFAPYAGSTLTLESNTEQFLSILTSSNAPSGILFGNNVTGNTAVGIIANNSTNLNGLEFRTGGNTTAMLIDSNLKVGIGDTTPDYLLDVAGTFGVDGNVTVLSSSLPGLNGSGLVAASSNAAYQELTRTTTTVSSTNDVGQYSSVAMGNDGLAVISYILSTSDDLYVTKCGNAACSSGNTTTPIDTAAQVGKYNSIAIGTDGFPVISYLDESSINLKVTKCGNAACSSGNVTNTVYSTGDVGYYTSIAIGADGFPVISHYDATVGNLKILVTKCSNADCSSSSTNTIDTGSSAGSRTSIAIGADGFPVVAALEPNVAFTIRITKCGNAACSASNTTTPLAGGNGTTVSLAVGPDGLPVFAYNNGGVKVTKCTNTSCTAGTHSWITSTTNLSGYYGLDLAIGSNGMPVISYADGANTDLRVARCANPACNIGTTTASVDTADLVGVNNSIAIGPEGYPVISYYDDTNDNLEFARCVDLGCGDTTNSSYSGSGVDMGNSMDFFRRGYFANLYTSSATFTEDGLTVGNGNGPAVAANGDVKIGAQTDTASTGTATATTNGTAGTFGSQANIDNVASSAVFKGKLFVATNETDVAGVYRYDGDNTWTLVTNAAGKAVSADTANIDSYVLAVHNGRLYIGSQTGASTGAVYYSETADYLTNSFTMLNATVGTFASAGQDGVSDMTAYNGSLIIATQEPNAAELVRYGSGTTFTQLNITDGKVVAETTADKDGFVIEQYGQLLWVGGISGSTTNVVATYNGNSNIAGNWVNTTVALTGGTFGDQTSISDTNSMSVYNGSLYISMSKTAGNAAVVFQVRQANLPTANTGAATFTRVNTTVGKLIASDAADIDSIQLFQYNGRLYGASTTGSGTAAFYEYTNTGSGLEEWTLMNTTRGTFGSDTTINGISTMVAYGDTLYMGSSKSNAGSVYSWSKTAQNSYGLKFDSGGENFGEISFVGDRQAVSNRREYGTFNFSHALASTSGAFDYAEDYPTLDSTLEAGEPVSVDPSYPDHVKRATKGEQVLGVMSENPGFRLSSTVEPASGAAWVPIALVGRVPVRVTTHEGASPINPGDALALSDTPGLLEKAGSDSGAVVGVALEGYSGENVGKISLYVSPQVQANPVTISTTSPTEGLDIDAGHVEIKAELDAAEVFAVKDKEGNQTITFDSDGNATFSGTLTADKIVANKIEGLEILTNKISNLESQVAGETTVEGEGEVSAPVAAPPVELGAVTIEKATVTLDLEVSGMLFANGGLKVDGPSEFMGDAIFNSLVSFIGPSEFTGDANFAGRATFNNDSGGFAVIQTGKQEVKIVFERPYAEAPVVTLTNKNGQFVSYAYKDLTKDGFTIILKEPALADVEMSWTALSVKNTKVTVSP